MWNLPHTSLNKEKTADFLIQRDQKENFQMSEIPLRIFKVTPRLLRAALNLFLTRWDWQDARQQIRATAEWVLAMQCPGAPRVTPQG